MPHQKGPGGKHRHQASRQAEGERIEHDLEPLLRFLWEKMHKAEWETLSSGLDSLDNFGAL